MPDHSIRDRAYGDRLSPELTACFRALADRRRRLLLYTLVSEPGHQATLDELADHLLAEDPRATEEERTALVTELYHHHLPRLAHQDIVDFDPDEQTVRYRHHALLEELLPLVRRLDAEG